MSNRRSFIRHLGAGASVALATAAAGAPAAAAVSPAEGQRLALLQDEQALRALHAEFERAMDRGDPAAVIDLFAPDARVVFQGGVFIGRDTGIARLYRQRFPAGRCGSRMPAAPGFEVAVDRQLPAVQVAPDRLAAQAAFPYSIQIGRPFDTVSSLAAMARLHGEGIQTWWEGGMYRLQFGRSGTHLPWQIRTLAYDTQSRADFRTGRSHAQPIVILPLSTRFPADEHGPDALTATRLHTA